VQIVVAQQRIALFGLSLTFMGAAYGSGRKNPVGTDAGTVGSVVEKK
jgi:hypothetical protein